MRSKDFIPSVFILDRTLDGSSAVLKLSDGSSFRTRRFFPAGVGDELRRDEGAISVFAKADREWVQVEPIWSMAVPVQMAGSKIKITFKEIENESELALFGELKRFHYRGGGGAGRTVPLIATTPQWDLPPLLGFIEVSSSMIANTARKRYLDAPFNDGASVAWSAWDRKATAAYSNIIARISRLVIHPELRGLGLAKFFTTAAREYSSTRWHYGGYRARFLEITADMLRFYPFIDAAFSSMGDTEGNQHRLIRDMQYLLKKALSAGPKGMPQGGGGIMTLQRGYASQLLKYLNGNAKSLPEVIASLKHNPSKLDQDAWESLHRLYRRPKPTYIAGLTPAAISFVNKRKVRTSRSDSVPPSSRANLNTWTITELDIQVTAIISQSSQGRELQDAFGFVGKNLTYQFIDRFSVSFMSGTTTLVFGASGSGKSLLLRAVSELVRIGKSNAVKRIRAAGRTLTMKGSVDHPARVVSLEPLQESKTALEHKGRASLQEFLEITARCGLAEPQLFVRSSGSLSSGQKYRLQIALAFLRNPEIIVIDNFLEPLDKYTVAAVWRGVESLARDRNVAVVAATAAYDRLEHIEPHQAILLRRGYKPLVGSLGGINGIQEGLLKHEISYSSAK